MANEEYEAYDADDDRDHRDPSCPICDAEMEWEDCDSCDEGYIDEHDDDPINFSEGECVTPCEKCKGNGGYLICTRLPHSTEAMAEWRSRRGATSS